MTDFRPDGYLPTQDAVVRAAQHWFADKFAALEPVAASETQTEQRNDLEAAVRVLSQPPIPDGWRHVFEEIRMLTVNRLRNFLHQGKLKAYYFGHDGRHSVSSDFWAMAHADVVIESGIYWPFGKPTNWHESRPNYSLFLLQSEVDALLSEQPANKLPLPRAKMPEVVAALRKLDDLPNREKQREALRKLPEFERYHLTDDVFREAEKQVPRKPGRKPSHPEQ
jgi:hypothetical protein